MDSSPGFASAACDSLAILKARFRCGSFTNLTSPHTATRWLILQKARRHNARLLRLLVGARFQVLFHSPLGVLFTFPSRYWFAIGHRRVFSLGGWSPRLRTGFHVPGPTRDTQQRSDRFRVRGSHPLRPALPCRSATCRICNLMQEGSSCTGVPQPPGGNASPLMHSPGFGLGALSLAATRAISVDFSSSAYLDVSVRRVVLRTLMVLGCG